MCNAIARTSLGGRNVDGAGSLGRLSIASYTVCAQASVAIFCGDVVLWFRRKQVASMETRDKFVMSVAFSPDNKWLASGGLDGLVNIFDVKVYLSFWCIALCSQSGVWRRAPWGWKHRGLWIVCESYLTNNADHKRNLIVLEEI